ncbi:MAG: hypothetical protein OEZ01_05700 [Candidatus Heimdallarchaeota archaeon]|nr:hypothetical protein [Candidatus Heimdallarchaeota archaeon]MDH5645479.1 hypothetical protein [Candidatus Heimdallarchaeota archaeon]
MKINKIILFAFLVLLVLSNGNSIKAQELSTTAVGLSGFISNDRFEQGSKVRFSGSYINNGTEALYTQSMNITFTEIISRANADPQVFNLSIQYYPADTLVEVNGTFTGTINQEINFEPGPYNVSLFFFVSDDPDYIRSGIRSVYSIANASITIVGSSQTSDFVRTVVIIIFSIFGIMILYAIINKFRK